MSLALQGMSPVAVGRGSLPCQCIGVSRQVPKLWKYQQIHAPHDKEDTVFHLDTNDRYMHALQPSMRLQHRANNIIAGGLMMSLQIEQVNESSIDRPRRSCESTLSILDNFSSIATNLYKHSCCS